MAHARVSKNVKNLFFIKTSYMKKIFSFVYYITSAFFRQGDFYFFSSPFLITQSRLQARKNAPLYGRAFYPFTRAYFRNRRRYQKRNISRTRFPNRTLPPDQRWQVSIRKLRMRSSFLVPFLKASFGIPCFGFFPK